MRIAVKGAGAIGSGIGASLQIAGEDVTLIGRPAHVAAIQKHGLLVEGTYGGFVAPVKAADELDFTPDLLLITTKVQDCRVACEQVKPYAFGVPTITVQNGISGDEVAASVLGKEQIIGCVVRFAVAFWQPGKIRQEGPGHLIIGEPFFPGTDRVERIAAVLRGGIETEVTDNLAGVRWGKLLTNTQMSVQAAVGLDTTTCSEHPIIIRLALALVKETLSVVDVLAIRLVFPQDFPTSAFDAVRQLHLKNSSEEIPPEAMPALSFTGQKIIASSMMRSRGKRKPTEVDFINGDVVRFGQQAGVPTPLNQRLVEIIHQLEETDHYLSPEELSGLLFVEPSTT